jgi:hypothetical protein
MQKCPSGFLTSPGPRVTSKSSTRFTERMLTGACAPEEEVLLVLRADLVKKPANCERMRFAYIYEYNPSRDELHFPLELSIDDECMKLRDRDFYGIQSFLGIRIYGLSLFEWKIARIECSLQNWISRDKDDFVGVGVSGAKIVQSG